MLVLFPIIYFTVFAQPLLDAFIHLTNVGPSFQPSIEFAVKLVPIFPWLIAAFKEFRGTVSTILESNLKEYINNPKYEDHIDLIIKFHEDFRLIVETYSGTNRLYFFIDDLDRCNAGKAAELMQAINMMVYDSPQVTFIIAMDRKKIAAGYAMQHEKVIPYLSPYNVFDANGKLDSLSATQKGLEYGYSFMEKFIQVPFRLPKPKQIDVGKLLDNLSVSKRAVTRRGGSISNHLERITKRFPHMKDTTSDEILENQNGQHDQQRIPFHNDYLRILLSASDSPEVKNIVIAMAPYFDNNPRRIKQFINMFRLYSYLADELGLLQHFNADLNHHGLTLEQLGKVVTISLRWPQLITEAIENERIVHDLIRVAYGKISIEQALIGMWKHEEKLLDILRQGCVDADGEYDSELIAKFGFTNDSFLELFKVAEPVVRLQDNHQNDGEVIVLGSLSQQVFLELVTDLLIKHFETTNLVEVLTEWWGKRIILSKANGQKILVEIERAFDTVDVHSIEAVTEDMGQHQITEALVITSGRFEGAAREHANRWNMHLWERDDLINLLNRYGYNVISGDTVQAVG